MNTCSCQKLCPFSLRRGRVQHGPPRVPSAVTFTQDIRPQSHLLGEVMVARNAVSEEGERSELLLSIRQLMAIPTLSTPLLTALVTHSLNSGLLRFCLGCLLIFGPDSESHNLDE